MFKQLRSKKHSQQSCGNNQTTSNRTLCDEEAMIALYNTGCALCEH
jgi:hypothetical protein